MYYVLDCPMILNSQGEKLIEIHNHFDVGTVWSWTDGLPFDEDEEVGDLPIRIDVDYYKNYDGIPPEFKDIGVSIMSARLKNIFDAVGVDNILYFPVDLHIKQTGQKYEYFAYKLIGRIAALDMKKSVVETYHGGQPLGDASILNLVIDETNTKNCLIFRLEESFSTIMVHEKIKIAVESAKIDTIRFINQDEYMHL